MLPPTLTKRTRHSLHNLLTKWTPPDRVKRIMDSVEQKLENPNKLTLKQFNRQLRATTPSLTASFPFHHTITKKIKKSLASHDVKVTSSSGTTLRDLLTKTKTTPPPHLTPNVIYEISCNDCTATYNGQTNRPLIKRIKEHESHSRLHLHNPDDFSHNQSALVCKISLLVRALGLKAANRPSARATVGYLVYKICSCSPLTDHWTQDSLGQNSHTHNYKIQDTTGPHRTHSH